MRRVIFMSWLLVLLWALAAFGDVMLYRGTGSIGTVQTVEESGRMFVPLGAVGDIFGFSAARKGEELLLTRGNTQIRFMLNSGAAWRGMSIIPLYSAPFERDGRIWIDSQSAVSVFQGFSGRGQNARLHFVKGTPQPVVAQAPQIQPVSLPQPQQVRTPQTAPQIQAASLPQIQQVRTPAPQPVIVQAPQIQPVSLPQPEQVRTQQVQAASPVQEEHQEPVMTASFVQPKVSEPDPEPKSIPEPEPVMIAANVPDTPEEIDLRLKELDEALKLDLLPKNDAPVIDISKPAPDTAKPEISEPVIEAANTQQENSQVQNIEDIDARLKQIDADNKAQAEIRKAEQEKAELTRKNRPVKPQPRLQTFSPTDSSTEKPESFSGVIQVIRWTASEGNTRKIKAVVEADDKAEPQVYISDGKIHALFAEAAANAEGLTSPYDNVKFTVNKSPEGVELVFAPEGFTKAEKLVLNNPRRIVFDFTFPDDAEIADPGQTAQTPAQNIAAQDSRPAPEIPTVFEPETPRRRSPAVTTLPSTITIPDIPASALKLKGRKTVVIDPGHGGKDPGASDNGVIEKNVNLSVGLELERILSARGYRVVVTRNTDVYLTLQERTDIANKEEADLFVSVHVNALPSKKSLAGFEIYIMALPTDKDAMELAKVENREYVEGKGLDVANVDRRTEMLLKILGDMQQNNKISESTDFAAALYNAGVINGLPMRRIAQAPFFVLRGAGMPAVLLEVGFLTNAAEAQNLVNPMYQQKIAQAMAAGIVNYLK